MKTLYPLVCFCLSLPAAAAQTGPVVLKSPDGAMEISIATVRDQFVQAAGGQLAYRVDFRGRPVIEWSNLGLAIEGSPALGPSVRIESSQAASQDETWAPVQGKASPIRNHYNAVAVQAIEMAASGRRLVIEARAYDDGVAFRYVVPDQPSLKELRILNESTRFNFAKDASTFSLISRGFQTSNEDDYHELTIGGLHPEYLVNLPVLLELPGVAWVGLTEADLEDYPNLFITAAGGRSLAARLATSVDDINTSADVAPSFDPKADAEGFGGRADPRAIGLACAADCRQSRPACGIAHGGQFESAQRHWRHVLDQARQERLGLVECLEAERQEQRNREVLHRLLRAEPDRVYAA